MMKAEVINIKMQEDNVEVEDGVIIKTEEVVSCHYKSRELASRNLRAREGIANYSCDIV
jgi:hypothetical protein